MQGADKQCHYGDIKFCILELFLSSKTSVRPLSLHAVYVTSRYFYLASWPIFMIQEFTYIWRSLLHRTLSFISHQSVITIWQTRKFGGGSDTSATYIQGQKWWSGLGILCTCYCNVLLEYSVSTALPFTVRNGIFYVRAEVSVNDWTAQLAERAEWVEVRSARMKSHIPSEVFYLWDFPTFSRV